MIQTCIYSMSTNIVRGLRYQRDTIFRTFLRPQRNPILKLKEVKQVHETKLQFEIKAAFFEITKVKSHSLPLFSFSFTLALHLLII